MLLQRRRVWLCWALLCALPALVAVLLAVTGIAPPPGRGGAFLSAVVSNGQLFPAAALALVLPVFLPITVAIVAGETVAGEATTGTLRYLLVREDDPGALNALLVAAGVRVVELAAQRRSLEQVVLERTGAGSDRVDARTDGSPR